MSAIVNFVIAICGLSLCKNRSLQWLNWPLIRNCCSDRTITGKNILKVLKQITIATGVMPPAAFGKRGPIPGYPRIHNTFVNFLIVKNYAVTPIDFKLYQVGPSLVNFKG